MFENNLRQALIIISQYEQKLQSYRQLLNEQIQFNIKDLYMKISGNCSQITACNLHAFLTQENNEIDLHCLQSIIKSYNSCTSMNLSFIQLALLFLSKQNRLLAKLTIQRNSLGDIPSYLLNYSRKILILQGQLHKMLMQFRKQNSILAQKWIKSNSKINPQTQCEQFDENIIKQICQQVQIQYETVLRYLKINDKQPIKTQKMLSLFTLKNCQKISQFLKRTQVNKTQVVLRTTTSDPFIRPQFHDCLQRPKIIQNFSYRQIKSIQKHLQRVNSKFKNQLSEKIAYYRQFIQKQLKKVCQAINDIIELEKQIQNQRIQLSLCTDFYPVLFFDSFNKERRNYLIPSNLQLYLQKLGVKTELNNLYTIFKRYSTRVDGKLTFNQFCSIFDPCSSQYLQIQRNRMVKSLQDIDLQTIRTFLKLIKILMKNELKIQRIKAKLQNEVDLRQVFSFFDEDQDGYLSITDFRVVWKKYLLMQIKQDDLHIFWHRMRLSKDPTALVKYEKFITQMIPKSPWIQKQRQKQKNRKGKIVNKTLQK